ncbi:hypothetical protein [Polaromonas sp. JS666]|uniref:hypothetical protein n=1 Tax=Polaromonas sp. (strain JS666 / ATCC BAA-500) TaxID=296591 RepID=UPI0009434CC2|nr:hypothetical protein [Polaromonas sp. JS666]
MQSRTNQALLWLVAIGLLFPLFIQLSGGVYVNTALVTDSSGVLSKLPLPISILAAAFGVLFFLKNYRQAAPAISFVAALVAAMLLSILFASETLDVESRKLLLAAQFLLPTMGLLLGQLVRDETDVIPRAFMWLLAVMVPVQLLAGWWQGTLTLTHYLYVFSIYQHFQFVPVIFVAAFCLALAYLWDRYKPLLRILTVVMGIYVMASAAFLAIGLYIMFVPLFFLRRMSRLKLQRWAVVALLGAGVVAAVGGATLYYSIAKHNNNLIGDHGQYLGKFQTLAEGKMPVNIRERLGDWKMYGSWITESPRTLLFGHVSPPAREVRTSAHNWYLDFTYNFGLISLLPFLALIAYTARLVWRWRASLPEEVLWCAGIVAFLVLVDSSFKVTLRQPYSGIFAFFLWGLLLSRLRLPAASRPGV